MNLKVLVDNNTLIDRYFRGEPGVSFFIEDGSTKILFDVGYSSLFIENAFKMGINLLNLDFVVLSHGHIDHTWGLDPLVRLITEAKIEGIDHKMPTLVAHPDAFLSRKVSGLEEIGSLISEEKLSRHFKTALCRDPFWLTDRLVFLGEIGRENDFEAKRPLGTISTEGSEEDDFLRDDSALAYRSTDGLVIVSGCSHSGICNIIEQARRIFSESRVLDVVGGFHLMDPPVRQMRETLRYFERLRPREVHACHCTDLESKVALAGVATLKDVGVGLDLEYD